MGFVDIVNLVNKQAPNSLVDLRQRGVVDHPHISTGSFVIDWVTGIGGIPRGKLTEFHGLQSSGKTTISLMVAAQCQAAGEGVLFIDFEHAADPVYAQSLGVSLEPDRWAINQPASMEEGLRIAKVFMEGGGCGLVIVDSVAAMVPAEELNGEIGDTQIGLQARQLSVSLRQLKHVVSVSNTALLFINQLRDVVDLSWAGQMRAKAGPQYTTPGGRALKFYADMRIEFMPTAQDKREEPVLFGGDPRTGKGKVVVGQKARVTAVKNKCAAPYRSAEIYLRHGKGIDSLVPCVDLALKFGIIKQKSSHFVIPSPFCGGDRLEQTIQGRESLEAYFEQQPEKLAALQQVVADNLNERSE